MTNYLLVCWQRWWLQLTPSACYIRSVKANVMCGTEGQRVFEQRGKKESRAYDELLQINWPTEVKPLLYFLTKLIQNPNILLDYNFRIQFSAKRQQYLFAICARFYFCWLIFCRDLQIGLDVLFRSLSRVHGYMYFWKFQHMLKDNKLCLISMRTW